MLEPKELRGRGTSGKLIIILPSAREKLGVSLPTEEPAVVRLSEESCTNRERLSNEDLKAQQAD